MSAAACRNLLYTMHFRRQSPNRLRARRAQLIRGPVGGVVPSSEVPLPPWVATHVTANGRPVRPHYARVITLARAAITPLRARNPGHYALLRTGTGRARCCSSGAAATEKGDTDLRPLLHGLQGGKPVSISLPCVVMSSSADNQ
jgi:hypothetical protein